jgi:hypothetical protein
LVRTFILALMITLLPVRGWVAEAMAMALVGLAASSAVADSEPPMPPDCPMHAQGAPDGGEGYAMQQDAGAASQGACSGCDSCELCLPLFSVDAAVSTGRLAFKQPAPVGRPAHFASAEPAPGLKPPIS